MSSPIYNRIMEYHKDNAEQLALEHKVWDNTPFIIDVHIGSMHTEEGMDRFDRMHSWLEKNIGDEAWPIHDKPGNWHRAGATVDGWTWIGFHTQEMADQFTKEFPLFVKAKSDQKPAA